MPIDSIKLILPPGRNRDPEVITLPGSLTRSDLALILQDHHLEDFTAYLSLIDYDQDGKPVSLNKAEVEALVEENGPRRPHDLRNPTSTSSFSGPQDFRKTAESAHARMEDETKLNTKRRFRIRNESEPEGCDFESDQPISMQMLEKEVNDFLTLNSNSQDHSKEVNQGDAANWVKCADSKTGRTLVNRLDDVIREASFRGIIYHEPHHELTPGMILIDEIFLAMVKAVADLGAKPNEAFTDDLQARLLQFVIEVATGAGASPGAAFGTYILRAGNFPCSGGKDLYHVDPARIELFLENSKIKYTSVIVGAWAGGTHSAGHTS